jgi:Multimeric flavodoxin WrbA
MVRKCKEILVVVGSGMENANTDTLAEAFRQGAIEAGHTVSKVFLGDANISPCNGCNACQHGNPCVVQDDMQTLYPLFNKCDVLVLASPLYFWTVSSRTKAFVERLYAEVQSAPGRYAKTVGKECALLMTSADPSFNSFENAVGFYRLTSRYLGWIDKGMVLAGGCGGTDVPRRVPENDLKAAYILGKAL